MILPRWVPWVTNEGWPSVTGVWDPPSKWTPDFVLQQARHFINAAKVSRPHFPGPAQSWLAPPHQPILEIVLTAGAVSRRKHVQQTPL